MYADYRYILEKMLMPIKPISEFRHNRTTDYCHSLLQVFDIGAVFEEGAQIDDLVAAGTMARLVHKLAVFLEPRAELPARGAHAAVGLVAPRAGSGSASQPPALRVDGTVAGR